MKPSDPIIEELRAFRDALAKKYDYDVDKIAQAIRESQLKSGWKVVTRPPKRISKKAS